ncbi:MAG: NADPH-dependent FMN reductase [Gemmatimonadales bacterium]
MSQSRSHDAGHRIVGVVGSLRAASFNHALLRAAQDLAPASLRIECERLDDLPLFNPDLEVSGTPSSVTRLRSSVGAADGILLVTPEYNHGVPGVLKNAIDWLSQPLRGNVLQGRPVAIMGASTGLAGTARAQTQLRQSFVLTNTPVMLQPEVLVSRAHEKFDAAGRLTDEATRHFVTLFLTQFAAWVARGSW